MLTIKDILHIPYPEEQKELKPGYTVLNIAKNIQHILEEKHFNYLSNSIYRINLDGNEYTIDGKYELDHKTPRLIVIYVPKVPKKIRLAPALVLKTKSPFISEHLYASFEEADECLGGLDSFIIWPAPPIGQDGFYEFSEEDWK